MQAQVVSNLPPDVDLKKLVLLPTCGTKFYRHAADGELLYSEDCTDDEKAKIVHAVKQLIAECSLRLVGATSVDVTRPGSDRAYGIRKRRAIPGTEIEEMMLIGDALCADGNDSPARETGVACIQIRDIQETKRVIDLGVLVSGENAPEGKGWEGKPTPHVGPVHSHHAGGQVHSGSVWPHAPPIVVARV